MELNVLIVIPPTVWRSLRATTNVPTDLTDYLLTYLLLTSRFTVFPVYYIYCCVRYSIIFCRENRLKLYILRMR